LTHSLATTRDTSAAARTVHYLPANYFRWEEFGTTFW